MQNPEFAISLVVILAVSYGVLYFVIDRQVRKRERQVNSGDGEGT